MSLNNSDDRELNIIKNQQGQSFVEFVLLLSVIMLISLGFLKIVNINIGKQWRAMAQVLVEDQSQQLRLR